MVNIFPYIPYHTIYTKNIPIEILQEYIPMTCNYIPYIPYTPYIPYVPSHYSQYISIYNIYTRYSGIMGYP